MELGIQYTYDDPNSQADPQVVAVADRINANDSSAMGRVYELFGEMTNPLSKGQFSVLNRQYTPPNITITGVSGAGWDTTTATEDLPIPSDSVNNIVAGDTLLVEDEIVIIQSVDRTANTVDVYARGAGETTAVAHGTTAITANIIGNAFSEGKVATEGVREGTDEQLNYTQLFSERMEWTFEDTNTDRKLSVGEQEEEENEAMQRLMRDLARTAIHGTAQVEAGDIPSLTRGLLGFMGLSAGTDLSLAVGGEFTLTSLNGVLNKMFIRGGVPNAIVMSPANKIVFDSFTSADNLQQDVNDETVGRVITGYKSGQFGTLPVIVDLDMPNSKVEIVDTTKLKKKWVDGDSLRMKDEPPQNSRHIVKTYQGSIGFSVTGVGTSHGELDGLTTVDV